MITGYLCPPYHAAARTPKGEQTVYGNLGARVPRYPCRPHPPPPLKRLKGSKQCMVTRLPVSFGTWVACSGPASTAPPPVEYPVPNFEAGVQLYYVPGYSVL